MHFAFLLHIRTSKTSKLVSVKLIIKIVYLQMLIINKQKEALQLTALEKTLHKYKTCGCEATNVTEVQVRDNFVIIILMNYYRNR